MRRLTASLLGLVLAVVFSQGAEAHRLDESYIYFNVTDTSLSGRFEALLSDLDEILGLDEDGDGTVSEAELQRNGERVFDFFADRLVIVEGETPQEITLREISVLETDLGAYGQIGFDVPGIVDTPEAVTVDYRPLADALGRSHAGFVLVENNTRTGQSGNESYVSLVFDPDDGPKTLSLVGEPWYKVLVDFVAHGAWHIWIGFDHVVFLVLLLLPSVMFVADGRWAPLASFRSAFWNIAKIVTVFTVSHSVTLSLAAFGVVQLPVRLVESIIAASIIAVAIMHFFPNTHRYVLLTVFVFGLFHGFGFANVLAPLGLDPTSRLLGIAAFNIGVELGQLAIVAVAFPLLWLVRRWRFYPPLAFKVASAAMIVLAGVWFLERTTSFEWNPRATITSLTGIEL